MNDQILLGGLEVHEFKQVAGAISADAEALGRVMFSVDVIEAQGVLPRVADVFVDKTVPVSRLKYLHPLSVTRLSAFCSHRPKRDCHRHTEKSHPSAEVKPKRCSESEFTVFTVQTSRVVRLH